MPSSSFLIGMVENELTVSAIEMTSGNSRTTAMMSAMGERVPVEVSEWMKVMQSNLPVARAARTAAGSTGWPHSNFRASAYLPQRLATSFHLSENAPFMQLSTPLRQTLRRAPSITPQAELVAR